MARCTRPVQEWLEALGVTDGGLANLIRATYAALGLRTYFTSGAVCVRTVHAHCWVKQALSLLLPPGEI